ncbi:MAG: protein kinase, partial [Acidobacteriota bacterium]
MTTRSWRDVDRVLCAVFDAPVTERSRRLDELCAGRPTLRQQVDRFLAYEPRIAGFLEPPRDDDRIGQRIGMYRLEAVIGAGGMGTVYRAVRSDDFHKVVAVKVLRPGLAAASTVRWFERERQILAELDHPAIVRLIDGGATPDGLPYLVMDHVDGVPIDRFVVGTSRATRLRLLEEICAAVSFA